MGRVRAPTDRVALASADVAQAFPDHVRRLAGIATAVPGACAAGPAFPCACEAGDNLGLHRALALAPAGSVLVCKADADASAAYAGELMTLDASARGLAGLVVAGPVRDTAALTALGFPVFACGTSPLTPTKQAPGTVGEPIVIGGVDVVPGDLVVADDDGVLVLRGPDLATAVAQVGAIGRREEAIRAALGRGSTLAAELGLDV